MGKHAQLLLVFHTFHNRGYVQAAAQVQNTAHNLFLHIAVEAFGQRAVNLDRSNGKGSEIAQRGVPHAKIVNGKAYAQYPQPGEQIKRVRIRLKNGRFGNLQLKLGGGKLLPVQGIQHHFGKVGVAQLARGNVYGHYQIVRHGSAPCCTLFACL